MIWKLRRQGPGSHPAATSGLGCIVDVETTGLSAEDEVIELGMVLFQYDRPTATVLGVVDEYTGLREPGVPITPGAYAVHGISLEQLKGHRLDYDRVEEIFTRAEFIVAHNASFDRRFVVRLSETAAEKPWLCTMRGVNWYAKGCRSRQLQVLLREFHVEQAQAHRALADVYGVLALLNCRVGGHTILKELLTGAGMWHPPQG